MSSFFFTFFSALFGTGFREPFYQFSLIWQDFFFTFLPFFVTLLLRFCYSFLRPLRKAISRLSFIVPFWHGKTFFNFLLGRLIRSRRLAHPSSFPCMSLDLGRLHSMKRRFNEIGV